MNTTPKTDKCISMLGEAQIVFSPYRYNSKGYFDKAHIIGFLNRVKAMLDYRLFPFGVISMPENVDKETARANPILQNVSDFEGFWYAMKNYPLVTADDLKNEFWSICPDLESIPKFLDVMNVKFDEVNYNYETEFEIIKEQYSGLNELVKVGKLTEQDADEIYWNIHFIAKRYNFIMEYIRDIYGKFRKMAEPQQRGNNTDTAGNNEPQQINVLPKELDNETAKGYFDKAIKDGFMDTNYQFIGTKYQMALFAEIASEKLNIKHKWKVFETLWNVKNLAQTKHESKERFGKVDKQKEIEQIFE